VREAEVLVKGVLAIAEANGRTAQKETAPGRGMTEGPLIFDVSSAGGGPHSTALASQTRRPCGSSTQSPQMNLARRRYAPLTVIRYSRRSCFCWRSTVAQSKPTTDPRDRIVVDPSAEQRLADILKRALSTPSSRHGKETNREKPAKAK